MLDKALLPVLTHGLVTFTRIQFCPDDVDQTLLFRCFHSYSRADSAQADSSDAPTVMLLRAKWANRTMVGSPREWMGRSVLLGYRMSSVEPTLAAFVVTDLPLSSQARVSPWGVPLS